MNNFFLDSQTVERHKATVAFPQSFFKHNFQYADKTQRVTYLSEKLLKTIGIPYYCDLEWGFFLYNNDCIESMEKIQKEPCFINLVLQPQNCILFHQCTPFITGDKFMTFFFF